MDIITLYMTNQYEGKNDHLFAAYRYLLYIFCKGETNGFIQFNDRHLHIIGILLGDNQKEQ